MSHESGEKITEKIAAAAIRLDGEIFTGRDHLEAIMQMEETVPDWETLDIRPEDGFVTNTGRYVEREMGLASLQSVLVN
jgi:tartrate dehydratase beta subunit/fumarate hydratase class I family protein